MFFEILHLVILLIIWILIVGFAMGLFVLILWLTTYIPNWPTRDELLNLKTKEQISEYNKKLFEKFRKPDNK